MHELAKNHVLAITVIIEHHKTNGIVESSSAIKYFEKEKTCATLWSEDEFIEMEHGIENTQQELSEIISIKSNLMELQ